ncbi:uncharacterized protein LOC132276234 [Cornus florida]|uniref:uncharacterized protein LOC132276234 n=1 Tax=Cornus florida TaxID=4283 RepID=UPI0028998669|nr:uncharacterized protein LOC132276234 [Cornus florida]
MSRRLPLHTCGVSILETAHRAYKKAQDINGPIGSMTKTIATLVTGLTAAFPFVYTIQCQCLAVLSFADGYILAVENIIETLFPPSTRLFNKIDDLVLTAEALPVKFDNAVNKFPTIIHQVPFLDWALVYSISWLNFVISRLTHWGFNNTREKDIVVDINCNNVSNESDKAYCHEESPTQTGETHCPVASPTPIQCENEEKPSPKFDSSQDETGIVDRPAKFDVIKCSYKEMLEKGKNENSESTEGFDSYRKTVEGDDTNKSKECGMGADPILELFETSWHMNTPKAGK